MLYFNRPSATPQTETFPSDLHDYWPQTAADGMKSNLDAYALGQLDAEQGELCCPEIYFVKRIDMAAYAHGFEDIAGPTLLSVNWTGSTLHGSNGRNGAIGSHSTATLEELLDERINANRVILSNMGIDAQREHDEWQAEQTEFDRQQAELAAEVDEAQSGYSDWAWA